jgi:hypothetical protein
LELGAGCGDCPECGRDADGRLPRGTKFAAIDLTGDAPRKPHPLENPCGTCGRGPMFFPITLDGGRELEAES